MKQKYIDRVVDVTCDKIDIIFDGHHIPYYILEKEVESLLTPLLLKIEQSRDSPIELPL